MFFMLVDELSANPKIRRLLDRGLEGDATGAVAMTLWSVAGTTTRAALSDGVVSRADTVRILLNHEWADTASRLLVDVELWHDAHTEGQCETCMLHLAQCKTCRPLAPGEFRFHDWWQRGYDHGATTKLTIAKKKELQDKKLRTQVWARDSVPGSPETAHCRLCGHLMNRQDRRSDRAPEMDHIDPWLAIGASNLISVCRTCNRQKGQRTPEEAGMSLRPAPVHRGHRTTAPAPIDSPPAGAAGSTSSRAAHSPLERAAGSRITVPVAAGPVSDAGEEVAGSTPRRVEGAALPSTAETAVHRPVPGPRRHRSESPASSDPGTGSEDREVSSRGCARVGGPGDGEGSGEGAGPGAGGGRRRRRRGRGKRRGSGGSGAGAAVAGSPVVAQGRGGAVPPVDYAKVQGREGSPFRGYRGPWVDRDEESTCARHGLDRPCWKCDEERA